MTLASVNPGDIVRVDARYAVVVEKQRGRLQVQWLRRHGLRWVKAAEVECHWRRSRAT